MARPAVALGAPGPALSGARRLAAALPWVRLAGTSLRLGPTPEALVAAWARLDPGRPALLDAEGELSYGELAAAVARYRRCLTGHPAVLVAATRPRGLAAAVLGGLSAGCRVMVVPTRSGDGALGAARAAHPGAPVLGDSDVVAPPPPTRRRGRPRLVFATSGSTGAPRGVELARGPAAAAQRLALLGRAALPPRPLVGCLAPLDHGHGFGALALTLALGGTLWAGSAVALAASLDVLTGVPLQLLEHARSAPAGQRAALVVSGSDRLRDDQVAQLEERFSGRVLNAYGATEVGTVCVADAADRAAAPGTVGRPLTGVRVRVVDASGRTLGRGSPGLIELRSPAGGRRPFRGDRGFLDAAGYLHVTGRADGLRVSGGELVDPERLSAWLAAVPGVVEVELSQVPDARFGSRPVARLRVAPGTHLDAEALRARIVADLGPALAPARLDIRPA